MKRIALALSGLGLAIAACQVVAGIDRVEKSSLRADAGPGEIPPGDPCTHAIPPSPPDEDDDRDLKVPSFYLAVRDLKLTKKSVDELVPGADLDGVCTCEERPGTARAGASSCTPRQKDCDTDGGVDNAGEVLFREFEGVGSTSIDEGAVVDIQEGKRGLLMFVSDWNGLPNDREVSVSALISEGITDPSGCGETTSSEAGKYHPGWCGADKWTYPPGLVVETDGQRVPIAQSAAYVSNGTLVLKTDSPINIFFTRTTLEFRSPVVMGQLVSEDGKWKIKNGLLAGRIPVEQLLVGVGQFSVGNPDGGPGRVGLCETDFFQPISQRICDAVDISRTSAFDFKSGACDAVSSAISFEAEQATVGTELASEPASGACADSNRDIYKCP